MKVRESHILIVLLILSMVGIGLATFLVANHYQLVRADFCTVGALFSCEKVNQSDYSVVLGIPWAVIGLVGFVAVFALAYLRLYYPDKDTKNRFIPLLLVFSVIGTAFIIYLNYLELFVINEICLLCAASHTIMVVILILVTWLYLRGRHDEDQTPLEKPAPASGDLE